MANAPRRKSFWVLAGEYMSLAFLLPSATLVGWVAGYLLDKALGTSFLKVVFLLLGIAGGILQLVRQVNRDTRNSDNG